MNIKVKKAFTIILKAADIVAVVFLCLLLAYNLLMLASRLLYKEDFPKVFGIGNAIILTGSMRDTLEPGDMVFVKEYDAYRTGDIITFEDGATYTTHRIVGLDDNGDYITKGDANNKEETASVKISSVEGKVIGSIPKIGLALEFLKKPIGIILLIAVGAFLIYLPEIIKKSREKHQTR